MTEDEPVPPRPVDEELLDHPPGPLGTLFHDHVGRRGALLLILAAMDTTYGAALFVASFADSLASYPRWWPASLGRVLEVPTRTWGLIWIGVGLFLISGAPRRFADRWQFAAAVALKYVWAGASLSYWITTQSAGVWGLTAIYGGIATAVLMASGWRDVRGKEIRRLRQATRRPP